MSPTDEQIDRVARDAHRRGDMDVLAVVDALRSALAASPSRPPASWRAIYERLFEKGPDSFSLPERETIRAAIEEAWNAGAAASPSREAPASDRDLARLRMAVRGFLAHAYGREIPFDLHGHLRDLAALVPGSTPPAPASREAPGDLAAVEKLTGPLDADRWYIEARVGSANHRGDVVRFINDRRSAAGGGYWNAPAHEVFASLLSAVARLSRNEGTALAPWYEADGSTVMLPVAEAERRRKLAAKVIGAARKVASDHAFIAGQGAVTCRCGVCQGLRALDAASPPPPTPEAKPCE
jgi:hypothetical protein